MWDTSGVLSDQSLVGQVFAALVGYIARPNGIEVLCYLATVATVLAFLYMSRRHVARTLHVAAAMTILPVIFLMFPSHAHANEVLEPWVTKGEWELEQQGYVTQDRNTDNNNSQDYENGAGATARPIGIGSNLKAKLAAILVRIRLCAIHPLILRIHSS